eukprot:scaffold50251_cov35-Cyclotella_meneghiniana.AAC.1
MPTVNQMNTARQKGDIAGAGSTQKLWMQQTLHSSPPLVLKTPLPLPPSDAYPLRLEESVTKLLLLPGHLLLSAVDSRLGQHPRNERRSQRESENQQSTTAAHTSLSVQ